MLVRAVILRALLLVLLLASSAWANPARVQTKSANSGLLSATVAVTLTNNVVAGNIVAVCVAGNATTSITGVADGQSNVYNLVDTVSATGERLQTAWAGISASGSLTITATFAAAVTASAIAVHEISGAHNLDVHTMQSQVNPGTGADAVTSGAVTTTVANAYVVGCTTNTGLDAYTAGTGYTIRENNTTNMDLVTEDKIQATAASVSATYTATNGLLTYVTSIMAFRPANAVWMESGTDATQGIEFWSSKTGTVASDSTTPHTGLNSVKANAGATLTKTGILADAGTRVSFYWNMASAGTIQNIVRLNTSGGTSVFCLWRQNATQVQFGTSCQSATNVPLTASTSVNTYYRWGISYIVTSTTSWKASIYLDTDVAVVNLNSTFTLNATQTDSLVFNPDSTAAFYDDIYVDDGGMTRNSPGNVLVTAKLPTSNSTNNFDTAIGSCTNRWDCVDERPLSEAKGWKESEGATQVAETYGVQAASAGDVDISAATLVGRFSWVWAKRDTTSAPASGSSCSNTGSASGTTITCTLTVAVNDLVECAMSDQVGGSAPTFSDDGASGGNTYTGQNGGTNTARLTWSYALATKTATTVTGTFGSSASTRAIACRKYTNATKGQDTNPAAANDSTSQYDAPLTGALAQTNEVVFGAWALAGPGTDTVAKGASETDIVTAGTSVGVAPGAQAGSCINNGSGTGTTLVCSGIGGASGDLIGVVFADQVAGTAPTIADAKSGGSNSYTALTGGTNTVRCSAWFSRITGAPGDITITFQSSSAKRGVAAYRWTGSQATPLDKNPAMTNDTTSPYAGPTSGTLTQANEIVMGYGCLAGPDQTFTASTDTTAVISGGTTGGTPGGNSDAYITTKIVSATTAVLPTVTVGTNRTGITGTATFKSNTDTLDTDSTVALTSRIVSATTSIQPAITNTTANRTGIGDSASVKGFSGTNAAKLVDNGTDNAVTLTTSSALYTVVTTSATYGSPTVGMKSTGSDATYFYEGGQLYAYIPGAAAGCTFRRSPGLGTRCGSRQMQSEIDERQDERHEFVTVAVEDRE